eukprot:COSAG01_NODE_16642_length_1218_cov_2.503128_1_plen_197_part_00
MGLLTGDRFRVEGASQPEFNGFFSVFSHAGDSFSYQLAKPPDNASTVAQAGGAPQITIAGFYFGSQKPSGSLVGDNDSPNAWVSPEWWGAVPEDSGDDDTPAVQFALDCGFPVRFLQSYRVERVTIGSGTILDGMDHALVGSAKRRTNAVVELKGAMCDIRDLQVHSDFGIHYSSGMHWYRHTVSLDLAHRHLITC